MVNSSELEYVISAGVEVSDCTDFLVGMNLRKLQMCIQAEQRSLDIDVCVVEKTKKNF